MINVEYLKKLSREKVVHIFYTSANEAIYRHLKDETDLDMLSDCEEICLNSTFLKRKGKLDLFCLSASSINEQKSFTIFFRQGIDEKEVFASLNLPDVSYDEFISILKDSAKLFDDSSNKDKSFSYLSVEKKGDEYLFNNCSGKMDSRSLKDMVRDTENGLRNKEKNMSEGKGLDQA